MEEVNRTLRAYSLKAPEHKGLQRNVWGSLIGQLLLRTFDRAQRVYQAMRLRGFNGEYHTGQAIKIRITDLVYMAAWSLFFIIIKTYNLPVLIGSLMTGAVK